MSDLFPPLHANWFIPDARDKIKMDPDWIQPITAKPPRPEDLTFTTENKWIKDNSIAGGHWETRIKEPPISYWLRDDYYCRRCLADSKPYADASSFLNHVCEDLR